MDGWMDRWIEVLLSLLFSFSFDYSMLIIFVVLLFCIYTLYLGTSTILITNIG